MKLILRTLRPIYWPWCMKTNTSKTQSYTVTIYIVNSKLKSEILVLDATTIFLWNHDLICSKWPSSLTTSPTASTIVSMSTLVVLAYWWLILNKKLHTKYIRISIPKIIFAGFINILPFDNSFDQFILIFRSYCT